MAGVNRWLVGVGVVAIAVVVVTIVVVVNGGSGEQTAAGRMTTTTTARPASTLDPVALAEEPLWTSDVPEAAGADVRDGLAMVYSAEDLALIDVATGETRWAVGRYDKFRNGDGATWKPSFYGRPWLVDHAGKPAVLAEYFATNCPTDLCPDSSSGHDELGLVLLSGEDGGVIWRAPLLPTTPDGEDDGVQDMWAIDDDLVFVHVSVGSPIPGGQVDTDALRTLAIDLESGNTVWERPRWFPLAVTGDTVLGVTSGTTPNPRPMLDIPEGTVGALDRTTGEPKWDLGERFTRSQVILTAGTAAVVRGQAATTREQVLLAVDSGEVLTDFGSANDPASCASDSESLIACDSFDSIQTFDLASEEVGVIDNRPSGSIRAVWQDRIVLNDGDYLTIDRYGNQIDEDLPGRPVAATDDHVLFLVGDRDSGKVSCYPLGP